MMWEKMHIHKCEGEGASDIDSLVCFSPSKNTHLVIINVHCPTGVRGHVSQANRFSLPLHSE